MYIFMSQESFTLHFRTKNMVSFKVVWTRNAFGNFVVISTNRLKIEIINFFITEHLEDLNS